MLSDFILLDPYSIFKKKKNSETKDAGAALGHVFLLTRKKTSNGPSSVTPSSPNSLGYHLEFKAYLGHSSHHRPSRPLPWGLEAGLEGQQSGE